MYKSISLLLGIMLTTVYGDILLQDSCLNCPIEINKGIVALYILAFVGISSGSYDCSTIIVAFLFSTYHFISEGDIPYIVIRSQFYLFVAVAICNYLAKCLIKYLNIK